jgi:hypothetical protein
VAASPAALRDAPALCRTVRLTGGDDNGLTGGVIVAHLIVTNTGRAACLLAGRPSIRIPRLPHSITVTDIVDAPASGNLSGRVPLKPGARASALIWLNPGSCDRGRAVTFAVRAHVGWQTKSVPISNRMCSDGTGHIDLGAFQRM